MSELILWVWLSLGCDDVGCVILRDEATYTVLYCKDDPFLKMVASRDEQIFIIPMECKEA